MEGLSKVDKLMGYAVGFPSLRLIEGNFFNKLVNELDKMKNNAKSFPFD